MFDFFQPSNLFSFFFKAFAITLSFVYLIYTIVIYRQVQIMTKTLITKGNGLILMFSLIQILLAVLLIILSFVII